MEKIKTAIIGTGNIGSDLLVKIARSRYLECSMFAGRNTDSKGIARAQKMGVPTSLDSVNAIRRDPGCCEIVFDATTAESHKKHVNALKGLGKFMIDLTPSKSGHICVPALNIKEAITKPEVNLITCGGQSTIPIAQTIMRTYPSVSYIEIASSISSRSAGPGTRINIDEYVHATEAGIRHFSGVRKAKAILNLNPAEPPINMHNTVYAEMKREPDLELLKARILKMAGKIQKYVPGYSITVGPVYEDGRITLITEVVGLGDFLPKYAGNLDIMTCAAVAVAEEYAKKKLRAR